MRLGLTLERLAAVAGLGLRTVNRATGGQAVAAATADILAQTLKLPLSDILADEHDPDGAVAQPSPPGGRRIERTPDRLAELVRKESRLPVPAARKTTVGVASPLFAAALEDVYAAPGAHAGTLYSIRGVVGQQRPAADGEVAPLEGARHATVCFTLDFASLSGAPLSVTIVSRTAAHTRALQRNRHKAELSVIVRLLVVEGDAPFLFFDSSRLHAWAFVVEAVEDDGAPPSGRVPGRPRAG